MSIINMSNICMILKLIERVNIHIISRFCEDEIQLGLKKISCRSARLIINYAYMEPAVMPDREWGR